MGTGQTETKITALYERLSRDDEKSKVHKQESSSCDTANGVVFLLKCTNEFVVNRDDLFFTLSITTHTRRFIDCDTVNQFIEHKPVQFLKTVVFLDELGKGDRLSALFHSYLCWTPRGQNGY